MLRTWPLLLLLGCPAPSDTAAPHPTPPPDTGDTPRPAIVVEALPSLACADPATRISAGPFATYEAGDWGEQPFDPPRDHFVMGSGLAVGDLDDDGWNDIVVPRRTGLELYLGDGAGGLVEHSLPDVGEGGVGAAVVDFDGDGDLDVYLSQYQAHDRLLVNEGGARFRDGTAEAGIGEHPYGVGSSWADFDLDGDLDLLVLEHGNWLIVKSVESHLYENLGDGTFARMEGVFSGLDGYGHTLAGGFLDLDHDALPDLYLVNDYGWIRPNHGFTNRGDGVFETVPPAMGLDLRVCGMGLAATDLNGDDLPDLFMPSWTELRLLQSYEGIGWVDTTATSGITASTDDGRHVAWGSDFGDVDNDGDEDLIVGFGFIPANIPNPVAQPDALYLQQEGAFVEVSQLFGVADPGVTRGTLLVDVDGDGWLDLVKRNRNAPAVLRPARCGLGSWLGVQLFDETSANTRGVGATIRVQALGRSLSRVVRAGGRSLASGGPPEVHFGLDGVEVVTLEIEWPDGRHDVLEDVPARQRVRVRRLE
ncbi:MAG: CRTAC1 family protein [Alphaproteobacteria bacterium]|nr:CRTAC1 family protein [Alphaproteobacteria bacterium]